jgi:hypothetical protein
LLVDGGGNYLQRSQALFEGIAPGLDADEAHVASDCLLYNHRLLPVPGLSVEGDCFRRAAMIEHSRGSVRFGLDRADIAAVFADHPRGDFDRVLIDFALRTLRREPWTVIGGIFFG